MSASDAIRRVWARRPARAVARLLGRELFVVSMRDLLAAAAREQVPLVAFSAPAPAAIRGFARAARDADAPLLLVRPSGDSGEKGPEESRDDAALPRRRSRPLTGSASSARWRSSRIPRAPPRR